ncbi:MaoC/PaaZ C-terminal domain-containing protein [Streptomyces sp. NPDC056169]|uniref:MaoC/PaaZ C-terminal domain-containing protein n=1 Tax=Streptomyces sp. NPDC056169 TaxID=3345734 RepID=UPI0035DFA34A
MPLDVEKATSAQPVRTDVVWDARDVRLYHLALGAGVPETDPRELRYVFEGHERGLQVLPTFGVVAGGTGGVGLQVFDLPGVDIDLAGVLHGGQEITARRAGHDRPVLHGLCPFGMAVKAVTDRLLGADASAVAGCRTRFAGVFHPGETLRLRVWDTADGYRLTATAAERDDAPVRTDARITPR